jgi:Ca2+-binding RTX toxin-like protein
MVNSRAPLHTWVDMRNKSLDSNYAEYTFGSGSDRLILDDKTSNQAQKRIFMGKGHDDVTHTGTQGINQAHFDLGSGHDRISAQSATNAHIVLGNGNDILNIRHLKGGNQIEGGAGIDTYKLAKFTGDNSITDTEGASKVDFTVTKTNAQGQVINEAGFPIKVDLFGQWFFTTIEGRNSGTQPVPGKGGLSVNDFNFTLGKEKGDFNLLDKAGEALNFKTGDAKGHKISFADGSIQQNPTTGVWTKTVTVPQPPVLYGAALTASALAAPASDVVKTYELDDKGEWKEIQKKD